MRSTWIILLLTFALTSIALAQDVECPDLVARALDITDGVCEDTLLDHACYGNITISADSVGDPADFHFSQTGDKEALVKFRELRLGSIGPELQEIVEGEPLEWGISLMRIRAGLPDTSIEGVDLVMFGNVNIIEKHEDANSDQQLTEVTVSARRDANVRALPSSSTEVPVISSYASGDEFTLSGRNEAGDWLRVLVDDQYGWVSRVLTSATEEQVASLSIVPSNLKPSENDNVVFGPMQAFYFQSGTDDSPCAAVPDSGILVETPDGVGTIRLRVNEALLDIGSTVYLQAQPGGTMKVSVLEGLVIVNADSQQVAVTAGTEVVVPLNNDLTVQGPPQPIEAYEAQQWGIVGTVAEVPVHPPLTETEIETFDSQPISGLWAVNFERNTVTCDILTGGQFEFGYPNHHVAVSVQPNGTVQWVSSTVGMTLSPGARGTYFGADSLTKTAEDGSIGFFSDNYTINFDSPTSASGSIFAMVRTDDGISCIPHTNGFTATLVERAETTA
jgi:hypothetical protein